MLQRNENEKLEYKCDQCQAAVLTSSEEEVFSMWVNEARPDLDMSRPDLIFKGFSVAKLTKLWSNCVLDEIPPAVQSPISPIRLGLYKGTYGSHGIEIIKVSLSENGYELLGDKILGDPNVPAGKISLYVDLRKPITLNDEREMHEFDFVNSLDPDTLPSPYCFPPNASQPFSLSDNIFMRDTQNLPRTCKARYGGRGQIAAHGYNNPDTCRAQFIVFSEDYFGFLWLDLTSFSVFRLAEDDFS
ncbi:F-box only protein 31-A-like [Littorina saxatilis]|uniref:Uncharacterized protein n=1 Tax=Littorina saxatilis TaxID=31220 RepID=A0AAN9GQ90_9CAEN